MNRLVKTMRHSDFTERAQGAARATLKALSRGLGPRVPVNCKEGFVTWFN